MGKPTISSIKVHNDKEGFTFFLKDRLKSLKANVLPKVFTNDALHLFVCSQENMGRREYVICQYDDRTGYVGSYVHTLPYTTPESAKAICAKLTVANKPKTKRKKPVKKAKSVKKQTKKKQEKK
jgi:hypothetical protein